MAAVKKNRQEAAKAAEKKDKASGTPAEKQLEGKAASEKKPQVFPIIGIGASAGGLTAFEDFFSAMPAGSNYRMAFVLVQHLSPDHESMLTEIIQRCTAMSVFEVEDGVEIQPSCIYIIPPGRDLAMVNGTLKLLEPSAPRGHRLPIDSFFQSMAQELRERAIGIVLSGTGSDGTQGVRAIKEAGGMVMVQKIASSEYEGMPSSASGTGLADYELPPAEMPAALIAYVTRRLGIQQEKTYPPAPETQEALKMIYALLRNHTGHDFSQYKASSICRRIERRMIVHHIDHMNAYAKYMKQNPEEAEALFHDLLIGVTRFFRDTAAFKVLEREGISRLIARHPAGMPIRVWVPSCSTGEEAYSIAMLLQEQMEALNKTLPLMIFATDIDGEAISKARTGLYPEAITADVSPERLSRFFSAEADGTQYRVLKTIRDTVIFSVQNVIKDPPFSKMDLISCRNLMIYLDSELQKKLISLFHYALNPGGYLFLGTSETIGKTQRQFAVLNSQFKLYQRRESDQTVRQTGISYVFPVQNAKEWLPSITPDKKAGTSALSLRELTEQELLKNTPVAAALVNSQGDILYLHGKTGMYLEPAQGEVKTINILSMARQGLEHPLITALRDTVIRKEIISSRGIQVKTNGHFTAVDLTIRPVRPSASSTQEAYLYLVILEESSKQLHSPGYFDSMPPEEDTEEDPRVRALKQELHAQEEYLIAANEELESANEELKSSNEEMQTLNEELQSTNEELETSKEELQAINEELITVNSELEVKVAELSRANNDMNNLLAGTGIATVFVDHELRILRFTPSATRITNLILSDVGRHVGHITSNLVAYTHLTADVKHVLDTLSPREREVQATDGQWYTLRIQPYRTLENVIEGAVVSFVEITEMVNIRESLQNANDLLRLAVVVKDSNDAVTVQDLEGRILAWNPGAVKIYGWSEAEALKMNAWDRVPESKRAAEIIVLHQLAVSKILEPYKTQRLAKDGAVVELMLTATALINEAGKMYAIATTERVNT